MTKLLYKTVSNILSKYDFNYSIIFKDLSSSETISWHYHSKGSEILSFPSASTIKIFIAIEAYNQINKGIIFEDDVILIEDNMKVGGSGIISKYSKNLEISIGKLIYLMMTESDNTATNILINILGMDNINVMIKKLSINNSFLNRKMMDFNAIKNGFDNYTCAYDLATVLEQLYKNTCINEHYDNLILSIMTNCRNNSKIPSRLPSKIKIAHKTGELDYIENDAAIVFTPYGDYILTILTEGLDNEKEIKIISEISKIIYDSYIYNKKIFTSSSFN